MTKPPGYRLLAHTADIGLEATAPDREQLFVTAAQGFRALLFGDSLAEKVLERQVAVEADDVAALLVAWLNEILYLSESGHLVPADFRIETMDDRHLAASVACEPFDPARHAVERTAKAVTYHKLVVEECHSGWYARVYIDL